MISSKDADTYAADRKTRTEWYEHDILYYSCEFLGVGSILRLACTSRFLQSALINSDKAARFWCSYVENIIANAIPSTAIDTRHVGLSSMEYINTLKRLLTGRLENLEQVSKYYIIFLLLNLLLRYVILNAFHSPLFERLHVTGKVSIQVIL